MVNSLTQNHSTYLKQQECISEQKMTISALVSGREGLLDMRNHRVVLKYPVETEKELIAFVQGGNKQEATKLLNSL
jgi:hypothetical protein